MSAPTYLIAGVAALYLLRVWRFSQPQPITVSHLEQLRLDAAVPPLDLTQPNLIQVSQSQYVPPPALATGLNAPVYAQPGQRGQY